MEYELCECGLTWSMNLRISPNMFSRSSQTQKNRRTLRSISRNCFSLSKSVVVFVIFNVSFSFRVSMYGSHGFGSGGFSSIPSLSKNSCKHTPSTQVQIFNSEQWRSDDFSGAPPTTCLGPWPRGYDDYYSLAGPGRPLQPRGPPAVAGPAGPSLRH